MSWINQTISHYKILEKLGEGGMGVVYKARDTKLDRDVALKFLPFEMTLNPHAKERFIREAKTASKLKHNNICTIHDIDETKDGQMYIVMDYYQGETLKEKIEIGSFSEEKAVNIFLQLAEGLRNAHDRGIVHRDIKPANIIVTDEGIVKILDFGLAKLSNQIQMTKTELTPGTAAYMSPEHIKGEKIDQRSDIWSIGIVLYEMLSGQLPFEGDFISTLMYAILNENPVPITKYCNDISIKIVHVLNRALEKEPENRYQNINDMTSSLLTYKDGYLSATVNSKHNKNELPVDIKAIDLSANDSLDVTTSVKTVRNLSATTIWRWTAIISIIVLFTSIIFFSFQFSKLLKPAKVTRSHIVLPESAPLEPIGSTSWRIGTKAFALSPDGSKLVYVANIGGNTQLYLYHMNQFNDVIPIPDTRGAHNPFFSPDGKWVGFFADKQLKKIELAKKKAIPICKVNSPISGSWGPNNRILFIQSTGYKLTWIKTDGSEPQDYILRSNWHHLLPDDKTILVSGGSKGIRIFDLETLEEKTLLEGRQYNFPRYVPTGHLIYEHNNILMAVGFDLKTFTIYGEEKNILDDLRIERQRWAAQYDYSDEGTLVYIPGNYQGIGQLVWVNRQGEEELLNLPPAEYKSFDVSPDGKQLALCKSEFGERHIYTFSLTNKMSVLKQITFEGNNNLPFWTHNGQWITYRSNTSGAYNIYMKRVLGSDSLIMLKENTQKDHLLVPSTWSPDDKILAYHDVYLDDNEIYLYHMDKKQKDEVFASSSFTEYTPVFSPNGKWIAYQSNKLGLADIFVAPYPYNGVSTHVSPGGGGDVNWSPISNEIIYMSTSVDKFKFWAVPYTETPTFKAGTPRFLFEGDYLDVGVKNCDIAPDGRLLLLKPLYKSQTYTELRVVHNWFEELKSKFETGE